MLVYNGAECGWEGYTVLFRKKMPRSCAYCVWGVRLEEDQILCVKKGIRSTDEKCLRFRYDPCKRIPLKQKPLDFSKYDQEDFSL